DENPIRTLRDYSKPSHKGYKNTIELSVGNNVYEIDRATGGKLRNKNADKSWEIVENLSLYDHEEENGNKNEVTPDNTERPIKIEAEMPVKETEIRTELKKGPKTNQSKHLRMKKQWKHPVLSLNPSWKEKGKTYKVSPRGPVYDAILKKKITKKEDIEGNFKIPCNVGGQKAINALVDQGSDVNVIPYTFYMKLTDERPAETDIRLLLASHSYIYPLGIAEDILVEVAKHVYPVDFVILDIKENEKSPFILGTLFLTTAKTIIKFDKGTITLRSRKSKASPEIGRKDKASPGKGDEVQPIEEKKNSVPKMKGLFSFSLISKITKSTRGSAGCEFLKKSEHFNHPTTDPLALLENGVLKSFHSFEGEVLNDFPRFVGILITEFAAGGAVNFILKMKGNMIIKNFDLEPTIDAIDIVAEFYGPSRWKELSKESGSKILPCGNGSCWKVFKPIASLIAKGELK
nr:hypothetical protein [Tanacetum cinerariifolium]